MCASRGISHTGLLSRLVWSGLRGVFLHPARPAFDIEIMPLERGYFNPFIALRSTGLTGFALPDYIAS